jgi:hypothetical protein
MKSRIYKQYLVLGTILLLFGTTFGAGNIQSNSINIDTQQTQTNIITKNDKFLGFMDDFIPTQETKATEYWALIFAVGIYENAPGQNRPSMLAVADDLQDLLLSQSHWQADHIHKVKGAYCYRTRLLQELLWLAENSDEDDMVLVYLTTHGNSINDDIPPIDEKDGKDEVLVMYDGYVNKQSYVWDDLLNFFLTLIKSKGLCLIVDSCHSGGFNDISVEVYNSNPIPTSQDITQEDYFCNNANSVISSIKTSSETLNPRFITKSSNNQFNPFGDESKSITEKNEIITDEAYLFTQGFIEDVRGQNRIILMSCEEDSLSWGSDFTELLISGFWGYADYNSNGIISAEEAFRYADFWVNIFSGGRQDPTILDRYPGEFTVTYD